MASQPSAIPPIVIDVSRILVVDWDPSLAREVANPANTMPLFRFSNLDRFILQEIKPASIDEADAIEKINALASPHRPRSERSLTFVRVWMYPDQLFEYWIRIEDNDHLARREKTFVMQRPSAAPPSTIDPTEGSSAPKRRRSTRTTTQKNKKTKTTQNARN